MWRLEKPWESGVIQILRKKKNASSHSHLILVMDVVRIWGLPKYSTLTMCWVMPVTPIWDLSKYSTLTCGREI